MLSKEKLDEILPPQRLEELALVYNVDKKNQIRLPGKTVFLCLLHTLLHHKDITQRLFEETYTQLVGKKVDHSSFGKRLNVITPKYFESIFQEIHGKIKVNTNSSTLSALKLRFVDATSVTISAKIMQFGLLVATRSANKSHRHIKSIIEISEDLPNFLHLCTDKAENADSVALGATMHRHSNPGDLWIFDKGCHGRQRLLDIHEAKAFFLTPHTQQGLRVHKILWQADPSDISGDGNLVNKTNPPGKDEDRFIIARVEQSFFENSQIKQNKKWENMPLVLVHGFRFDKRSQTWKTMTLMTNLELSSEENQVSGFSFEELAILYQRRWDIEVFFKFIKQHLSYSHLVSHSENGIRVMIYMSLIAACLLIWYKAQTGIDRGWRSVKSWFAFDVQKWLIESFYDIFSAIAVPSLRHSKRMFAIPELLQE